MLAEEWEDDHPTQRSLPVPQIVASRHSLIRPSQAEQDELDGPPTIPSSPPSLAAPPPSSRARPTLTSPSDAPERVAPSPSSGWLASIPAPPRAPRDLMTPRSWAEGAPSRPRHDDASGSRPTERPRRANEPSLTASAPLPLVLAEGDARQTARALISAAEIVSPLLALEREVKRLRRRLLGLSLACALSLGLSLGLVAFLALDPDPLPAALHRLALRPEVVAVSLPVAEEPKAAAAKIQLVIANYEPWASVTLSRGSEAPMALRGPWPMALDLEPGSYLLGARHSRGGTFLRQLTLSPEQPRREVTIRFDR